MVCHEKGGCRGASPQLSAGPPATIAAVATPPGQGGVGIVRISGPLAQRIGEAVMGQRLIPRRVMHGCFQHGGEILDEGLALFFAAPRSFTGENVVELHGHGSPIVMQMILDAVLALGARLARPGEFTERAFLNDKLDLAQAEAVADLIASASRQAARGAVRSLSGEFSQRVNRVQEALEELRAYVEAAIDFPDEEIEFLSQGRVAGRIDDLIGRMEGLMEQGRQGVLLSEGANIAIIGPTNVGKSSLLNRLSGEDAAIVTDIPGTTRDLLRVDLVLDGLPVRLVDTAGSRESGDPIEMEGMRRAQSEATKANLVLEVCDLAAKQAPTLAFGHDRTIVVENKIDLIGVAAGVAPGVDRTVRLSCLTGEGVDALKKMIKEQVGFSGEASAFSARHRHLEAFGIALDGLGNAAAQCQAGAAGEVIAEELRLAHLALDEVTGRVTPDDLLGRIFSTFCIGK